LEIDFFISFSVKMFFFGRQVFSFESFFNFSLMAGLRGGSFREIRFRHPSAVLPKMKQKAGRVLRSRTEGFFLQLN
jgi:hypothetical protein